MPSHLASSPKASADRRRQASRSSGVQLVQALGAAPSQELNLADHAPGFDARVHSAQVCGPCTQDADLGDKREGSKENAATEGGVHCQILAASPVKTG